MQERKSYTRETRTTCRLWLGADLTMAHRYDASIVAIQYRVWREPRDGNHPARDGRNVRNMTAFGRRETVPVSIQCEPIAP